MRAPSLVAAAALAFASALPARAADVVFLQDGDRVSGTVAAVGKKSFRVTTPFGRLLIPADKIDKIVYEDGHEEVVKTKPSAAPWKVETLRLTLVVTGDSFWQAWDPKEAPADATLRLLVTLDDQPTVAYVDPQLDHDIPGAVVNTFAFEPSQTSRTPWDGAKALPPETKPGQVQLPIELAPARAGRRRLTLTYQANAGNKESPDWHDLASASLEIDLAASAPTVIRLEQARGEMSFKRHMRKTETFQMQLAPDYMPLPPAS